MKVASVAGQGEIGKNRLAAVLSGYDVLDLERGQEGIRFR